MNEPIFKIERIQEIRRAAHQAFLSGKPETDCPYLFGHEREIWLAEYRQAESATECA